MRRFALVAVLASLLVSLVNVGTASAHRIDESYIYVDIFDSSIEGRLQFNAVELNDVLGLDIPEDVETDATAAAEASQQVIFDYAAENFAIGGDDVPFTVRYDSVEALPTEAGNFVILHWVAEERFDAVPDVLNVTYTAFFDEVSGHVALFHIDNYWEGGSYLNESDALNALVPFSASNTSQDFDIDDPSFWQGFKGVVRLGVDHIKIGSDHILFILALLLPSVLVFQAERWQPSASFTASLWRVTKLATMFTIAHSITLSLAGFGILELPSRPVEIIIAGSIGLAALHNLWPRWANREWVLAFVFGLFPGLGFAGLLADLGLDRSNKVWSLLAFNLGVEIGQVGIILLTFPALYLLRRTQFYRIFFKVGSVILALVAFGWMIERTLDIDMGVSSSVDPFFVTPRAYVIMASITIFAVAWRQFEASRGMLIDPASTEASAPAEPDDPDRVLVGAGR